MPEWLLLVLGVVLTVGTGFFVASEFALVNLDRSDLEARAARGERNLGITIRALKITSTHLSSAQLGITLTTLLTGYTLEPAFDAILTPAFVGLGWSHDWVVPVSAVVAVAIATLISMILGELVPKGLSLARPRETGKIVIPFQVGFTTVFRPIVWLLNVTAGGILRIFGLEASEELSFARTAEELSSLVRRSARDETLDSDTATLLSRALAFSDRTARDVMTPRPRVRSVERTDSAQTVIELARRSGLSRFPVIDDSIDDVVGVVHVKKAVAVPRERRAEVPVTALQEKALPVPETMRLDVLLAQLRSNGYQMAIVVDEYSGTAGIVTLEDLVEELVGEVADEHDPLRPAIVKTPDGFIFPAILRPDELLERTGVNVPDDGPYETVAGWIMSELGRIPVATDHVDVNGGKFTVVRMDGRRVDRVRYSPIVPDESPLGRSDDDRRSDDE